SLSDALAVMRAGRIEQMGTPEELYRRPITKFVASFLGAVSWVGEIGVRPESIRIARSPNVDHRCQCAVVESVTFLGPTMHLAAKTENGGQIVAQIPSNGEVHRAGDTVHLWWDSADELRDLS